MGTPCTCYTQQDCVVERTSQVEVAMGVAQVVVAVEVGILPIEEPPAGGSGPYMGCGF